MAKIIWVGFPCFGPDLQAMGHECRYIDYPEPGACYGWNDLLALSGINDPDLVMVVDRSIPPFVLGVESFPCLTALYAIDTHIHSWFPYYAQAFDLCLVSLKDDIPAFLGKRLTADQVIWSPPFAGRRFADHATAADSGKEWDVLFVGKADPAVNPQRVEFLTRLKKLVPGLHVQSGNFAQLFPKARLVLNHSIAGDLNFRVFEALACGACLLTPKIAQGQEELFEDGKDLFVFDQDDLPGLAALIERLLADPGIRAKTALSGYEKVCAEHLTANRAKCFSAALSRVVHSKGANGSGGSDVSGGPDSGEEPWPPELARKGVSGRLAQAAAIHSGYLRLIYLMLADTAESPEMRAAYLAAAQNRTY